MPDFEADQSQGHLSICRMSRPTRILTVLSRHEREFCYGCSRRCHEILLCCELARVGVLRLLLQQMLWGLAMTCELEALLPLLALSLQMSSSLCCTFACKLKATPWSRSAPQMQSRCPQCASFVFACRWCLRRSGASRAPGRWRRRLHKRPSRYRAHRQLLKPLRVLVVHWLGSCRVWIGLSSSMCTSWRPHICTWTSVRRLQGPSCSYWEWLDWEGRNRSPTRS